eukprot:TRINITY_DN32699_c0_g1_i1.p1 TRINITY_DN32699_c0_g1~~TRINITY_DN32699_c0_g1_i1.p1  ORF type:complete len:518 (+),score=86.15 TRINITY_DN32699_c0_g1_i1:126-1556(+)
MPPASLMVLCAAAVLPSVAAHRQSHNDDADFNAWTQSPHVHLTHSGRSIAGRVLQAAEDIPQGGELLRQPAEVVVTAAAAAEDADFGSSLAAHVGAEEERLAWWLLLQRVRGRVSPHHVWISVLPRAWAHPLLIDEPALKLLRLQPAVSEIQSERRRLQGLYVRQIAKLARDLPLTFTQLNLTALAPEDFLWAVAVVRLHGQWAMEGDGSPHRVSALVPGACFVQPEAYVGGRDRDRLLLRDGGAVLVADRTVRKGDQASMSLRTGGLSVLSNGLSSAAVPCYPLRLPSSKAARVKDRLAHICVNGGRVPDEVLVAFALEVLPTKMVRHCASKSSYREIATCAGGGVFDVKVVQAVLAALGTEAERLMPVPALEERRLLEDGRTSFSVVSVFKYIALLRKRLGEFRASVSARLDKSRQLLAAAREKDRRDSDPNTFGAARRPRRHRGRLSGRRGRTGVRRMIREQREAADRHFDEL